MPDRGGIILTAALIVAPLVFLRPSIHGTDGVCNYVYVRSWLFDGDWDFTNDYAEFHRFRHYPYPFSRGIVSPETGRPDNSYGPGSAVLWMPFVLSCRALLQLTGHADLNNGYTFPFETAVGIGTVFWVSLGLLLLYGLLKNLGMGEWVSLGAVSGVWLLTPLFFYTYLHPSMSHGPSFFAAAAALYCLGRLLTRGPGAPRATRLLWLIMGFLIGLLTVIRLQDVPLAGSLGLAASVVFYRQVRQSRRQPTGEGVPNGWEWLINAGFLFFGMLLPLTLLLFVWKALYGSIWSGPRNYVGQEHYSYPLYFFHALFSPFHGLFYWHPALLVGGTGLLIRNGVDRGRSRPLAFIQRLGLAALVAQTLLIGSWWSWYGGASFGHRMFVSLMVFWGPGFAVIGIRALCWGRSGPPARQRAMIAAIVVFFIAGVYWNLGLSWLYGINYLPHEQPVPWRIMLKGLLVEIPSRVFGLGGSSPS